MSLDYVGASIQININEEQISYGFSSPSGNSVEDAKIAARIAFEKFLLSKEFDQMLENLMSECTVSLSYCAHLDMPH